MATLSNTLLMIPRELPSYLKVAYSLRYPDKPNVGHCFARNRLVLQRTLALIKEVLRHRPTKQDFQTNREKLQRDFEAIKHRISENKKPLCVYFVSSHDESGAILGNQLYYYHHYKIRKLQKHFAVAPKLVSSQDEMKNFMTSVKDRYAGRQIKFVDIVSHGSKSFLSIQAADQPTMSPEHLRDDLFSDCATDATIFLDACNTGLGDKNIADEIARKTPGRKILAPGPTMFFSKPVIRVQKKEPRVVSAVHGRAIFNAYVCKSFCYPKKMATQFPFVKDESIPKDILAIANSPILRNVWLDRFVKEDREDLGQQIVAIYNRLSQETKSMVMNKICKKEKHPVNAGDNFGETFLRNHPLHASVRSAFRSIFYELTNEMREDRAFKKAKRYFRILNRIEAIRACFRALARKPVIVT